MLSLSVPLPSFIDFSVFCSSETQNFSAKVTFLATSIILAVGKKEPTIAHSRQRARTVSSQPGLTKECRSTSRSPPTPERSEFYIAKSLDWAESFFFCQCWNRDSHQFPSAVSLLPSLPSCSFSIAIILYRNWFLQSLLVLIMTRSLN